MAYISCPLCLSDSQFFCEFRQKEYYRCGNCQAVLMDPAYFPTPGQEKKRYMEHNNDVNDPGYQSFVMPVVNEVLSNFTKESKGLDLGAGTGPVISKLLKEKGYSIVLYDPFFFNEPTLLEIKYDYIICCEVIEHFHNPRREFKLLRSILRPGGSLFCMTELYTGNINFQGWWYKNDETHVIFYHPVSLEWIKSNYSFYSLETKGRIIHFMTRE